MYLVKDFNETANIKNKRVSRFLSIDLNIAKLQIT
jgi:hypothetical protein